jgi:hypothetical protein
VRMKAEIVARRRGNEEEGGRRGVVIGPLL